MSTQRFQVLFSALFCLFCTPLVMAALQGAASDTESTAVTTITLSIEPSIQISNVGDIALDVADRTQDVVYEETICVRGNVGSRYSVIVASQNGNQNPFELQTEAGDRIGYEVYFRGDLSQTNSDQLQPGQNSPYYAMVSGEQNCDGNDTSAFSILFKSEDLLPAAPGIYSGFLTVTVAAE